MRLAQIGSISSTRGGSPEFLLQDEFTETTNPITFPRASGLTGASSGGTMQADGNDLVSVGNGSWTTNYITSDASFTRANGLCLATLTSWGADSFAQMLCNWSTVKVGHSTSGQFFNSTFNANPVIQDGVALVRNVPYEYCKLNNGNVLWNMLTSTGAIMGIGDRIVWISRYNPGNSLYAREVHNTATTIKTEFFRVFQLPAPFNEENGLAEYYNALPPSGTVSSGVTSTDTHQRLEWTPTAGAVLNVFLRRVDDNNAMIFRADQTAGTIALIQKVAGVETVKDSLVAPMLAGTKYNINLNADIFQTDQINFRGWISSLAAPVRAKSNLYLGSYFSGGADVLQDHKVTYTGGTVNDWEILPARLNDTLYNILKPFINPFLSGARTRQTIDVADGGDIDAAIATMKQGDIVRLAANGNYTESGAFWENIPSGIRGYESTINGNNALVSGGTFFYLNEKTNIKVHDVRIKQQTQNCTRSLNCYNLIYENVESGSDGVNALFEDVHKHYYLSNSVFRNCLVTKSNGVPSVDAFEIYNGSTHVRYISCRGDEVFNAFEVYSSETATGTANYDISFENCHAQNNTNGGYSNEGGPDAILSLNIVAINCAYSGNAVCDYEGVQGATLYVEGDTGGVRVGNVVDRS